MSETGSRRSISHVVQTFFSMEQAGPTRPGRAAAASGFALAPASLRERAGRLARDTGLWLCCGCVREREAQIVRSRPPPASSPLRVPIRPAPPRVDRLGSNQHCGSGSCPEGPGGSGVNGLTPGPLRLLGPAIAGRPGACRR
jgi:hypothetical protein